MSIAPITARSTKAEILEAYAAQTAALQSGPSWPQVIGKIQATVKCVVREVTLLGLDIMHGWRVARVCYNRVVAELARPIFKV